MPVKGSHTKVPNKKRYIHSKTSLLQNTTSHNCYFDTYPEKNNGYDWPLTRNEAKKLNETWTFVAVPTTSYFLCKKYTDSLRRNGNLHSLITFFIHRSMIENQVLNINGITY